MGQNYITLNDPIKALEKVRNGKLIYGNYLTVFDSLIPRYFSDNSGKPEVTFCQKQEWIMTMYAGYFVKKSPYLSPYNKFILATMANGMNIKWKQGVFNSLFKKHKHGAQEKNVMVLSMGNLQGSFMLLTLGLCISILVAIAEFFVKKLPKIL